MAKRATCPEMREPRRRSPDKVNWPPQFVSSNGTGELLPAGALEPDEAPFGSATCRLCNEGNLGRAPAGTAAPHVLERKHKERCERAREYYLAFWQELACPDERPYYYDHVSHTWTFARPPCLTVLAGVSPEADLEPGGPDDEELQERLVKALVSTLGSGAARTSAQAAAATAATASFGQPGGHHMQAPQADHMDARATRPAAAGITQATVPTATRLDPEADVESAEAEGSTYWYNPRTHARNWKREDLVALNTAFYREVMLRRPGPQQQQVRGPHGEESWWEWQSADGRRSQRAWTLVELYKEWEESTTVAETP